MSIGRFGHGQYQTDFYLEMEIKYFGVIAELAGKGQETLAKEVAVEEVALLRQFLEKKYDGLEKLSYQVSVNRKLVTTGALNDNDEIALLPPFSGG